MRTVDQDVALCAVIAAAIAHAHVSNDDVKAAAQAAATAFVAGIAAADEAARPPAANVGPASVSASGAAVAALKIEIDDSQVGAALEPLEQLAAAATAAEAALAKLWNIQAAMQCRHPYTGSGGVSGSIAPE